MLAGGPAGTQGVNSGGSGWAFFLLETPCVLWLTSLLLVWASFPMSPLRMDCRQLRAVE